MDRKKRIGIGILILSNPIIIKRERYYRMFPAFINTFQEIVNVNISDKYFVSGLFVTFEVLKFGPIVEKLTKSASCK